MTAQTLEAMIETIGDFFKKQPTGGKCHNCNANNPTIKRWVYNRACAGITAHADLCLRY
jgi:hypothetical protein